MRSGSFSGSVAKELFDAAGLTALDDFFVDVFAETGATPEIPSAAPETSVFAVRRRLESAAISSGWADDAPSFVGAGGYDYFAPSSVERTAGASAFRRAPSEDSAFEKGAPPNVWRALFRCQRTICRLTATDAATVFFDRVGGALTRACALAVETTGRRLVVVSETLRRDDAETLRAFAAADGRFDVRTIPARDGVADVAKLDALLDAEGENVATVVVQYPNFFGNLERIGRIVAAAKRVGATATAAVDPFAAAALKAPGKWGADFVAGEVAPIGFAARFDAPRLGFVAATEAAARRAPKNRVVGAFGDDGRPVFGLTLFDANASNGETARNRQNADSPEALDALTALVRLAFADPLELRRAAEESRKLAEYARTELRNAGFEFQHDAPFLREFAVKIENPGETNRRLLDWGIVGGFELDDGLLLAFTEKRTREEIDELVYLMKSAVERSENVDERAENAPTIGEI